MITNTVSLHLIKDWRNENENEIIPHDVLLEIGGKELIINTSDNIQFSREMRHVYG